MAMDYRDPYQRAHGTPEQPSHSNQRHRGGEEYRDTASDYAASVPRRGNVRPADRHER
jgi:hypothetical protein